jgi:hypothetical protein
MEADRLALAFEQVRLQQADDGGSVIGRHPGDSGMIFCFRPAPQRLVPQAAVRSDGFVGLGEEKDYFVAKSVTESRKKRGGAGLRTNLASLFSSAGPPLLQRSLAMGLMVPNISRQCSSVRTLLLPTMPTCRARPDKQGDNRDGFVAAVGLTARNAV